MSRDVLADQQLLVQLLGGPQPGVHDLDVAVGVALVPHRQAHQTDHACGEIGDTHRLAHVEHEHVPALCHRARLQHQLRGLGDRHEVADDVACVTVTGPPFLICSRNSGTTEPEESSTLPKRTMQKRVCVERSCNACNASSAKRLVAPITLVGFTALSVEISTNVSTRHSSAACAVFQVLNTLLYTPSMMFCSTMGTCLYAAAW